MTNIRIDTQNPEMAGITWQEALDAIVGGLVIPTSRMVFGAIEIDFVGLGIVSGGVIRIDPGLGGFTFQTGSFIPGAIPLNEVVALTLEVTRPDETSFSIINVDGFSLPWGGIGNLPGELLAQADILDGGNVGDLIRGYGGSDKIGGNGGWDQLFGDTGNDSLLGGKGNDTLFGGQGRDVLNGGAGRDVLTGGGWSDRFDFSFIRTSGDPQGGVGPLQRDVVTDFQRGADKLVINGYDLTLVFRGWQPFDDEYQVRAFRTTEGMLVQVNLGGTLTPEFEVLLAGLTQRLGTSDFIF